MAEVPRVPYAEFERKFKRRWKQGEHVFINGQTGSGKTDLLLRLCDMRTWSCVFVTKPRDGIFKSDLANNYRKVTEFKPGAGDRRLMLYGKGGKNAQEQVANQFNTFADALDRAYHMGGWTLGIDETLWIGNRLKLGHVVGDHAFMGRALGLTVIAATQRPAHIPVIIPQSASHAFIGKTGRKSDLATLAELGGDVQETQAAIKSLRGQHEFLYVDTQGILPLMVIDTHK
jgi:hypothetical protein